MDSLIKLTNQFFGDSTFSGDPLAGHIEIYLLKKSFSGAKAIYYKI